MATTIDHGYTSPLTSKNLAIKDWTYPSNWALEPTKTADNADLMKAEYVNLTSPLDRQARFRVQKRKVEDVYKGSGINVIHQSPIKEGYELRTTLRSVNQISYDNGTVVYSPREIGFYVKDGINPNLTIADVWGAIQDFLGMLTPTDSVTSNQLALWRAGSFQFLDETSEN